MKTELQFSKFVFSLHWNKIFVLPSVSGFEPPDSPKGFVRLLKNENIKAGVRLQEPFTDRAVVSFCVKYQHIMSPQTCNLEE